MTNDGEAQLLADEALPPRHFAPRAPFPEMVQRLAATASLVLLGALAVVFGFHFQHTFEIYRSGLFPRAARYQDEVDRLLVAVQVSLLVAFASMALWSGTAVANARRVFHSLRSVWVAFGGWVVVATASYVAHVWLDTTLRSGMFVAGVTFLLLLYLPHGTIAGATVDLGGNGYLARVWYLLELLAAILLWAALAGVSAGLPSSYPQTAMQEKAFLCFVSGLLLFAAAATFFAVARNISDLTNHKWEGAQAPQGRRSVPIGSVVVTRAATFVPKHPIPTWALRVAVCIGFATVNAGAVAVTFVTRRRAIAAEVQHGSAVAHAALVSSTHRFNLVIAASIAVHCLYVCWAILAAVNARRRTLLAPSGWAVAAAFLAGTVFFALGPRLNNTLGVTAVVVASAVTYVGFIIGQLLLGRSVVALGGSGRIFLLWLLAEFGLGACVAYVSRLARNNVQLLTIGGLLALFALLSSAFAWLAMARLDGACRAESAVVVQPRYRLSSRSLTSSHS